MKPPALKHPKPLTKEQFAELKAKLSNDLSYVAAVLAIVVGVKAAEYLPLFAACTPRQRRSLNEMIRSFFSRNAPSIPAISMWTRADFVGKKPKRRRCKR